MATIKFILDCRAAKKDAAAPLKVSIGHQRKTSLLPINIYLTPEHWDAAAEKVIKHHKRVLYNQIIARRRIEILDIINSLLARPGGISGMAAIDLKNTIRDILCPQQATAAKSTKPKANPHAVAKFFERYTENKGLRERTADMYGVTWRRIEAWLGVDAAARLKFQDINIAWIEDFDKFLSITAPNPNGRRMHHANLKAVINYAIDHEIIDRNPYRRYKIKTAPTKKRNMCVDAIRAIINADNLEPWMERYRDFFVLSFMLRGLNTVDLCHIGKSINGRVNWYRTKTGQPLSLKIEPEMQVYIDRWAGKEHMLLFAEERPYRNFNTKLSNALHKIREHINKSLPLNECIPDFTMYWARHTWATIAHKLDIGIDVISSGLGHSEKSVTEIYIERDPEKIDVANRRVLDYVLYGRDYRVLAPIIDPAPQPAKRKPGRPKKNA